MKDQLDPFKKIIKELSTEKDPLKLVIVDWASKEQHQGSNSPLRDKLDVPVLQSAPYGQKGNILKSWVRPEIKDQIKDSDDPDIPNLVDQWLESFILIDKEGKAIGGYPLDEGMVNGKKVDWVDLKKEDSYQKVKKHLSSILEKSREKKAPKAEK